MPKDNIERAIKKGTGELAGENLAEVRYEGYGPAGVAVIVDTLTDNRNRTVGEVRRLFTKYGGNLGAAGCVAYLFERKGMLLFDAGTVDGDKLMEVAIEANALDVSEEGDCLEVQTAPEDFDAVRERLSGSGFEAQSAEIAMLPQTTVKLAGKEAQSMLKLFEGLDDHEDVKEVYANFDISDAELMEAAQAS